MFLNLSVVQGLFQQRRAEHKAAVETILNFRENEKQQKMVNIIASKAFEVRCEKLADFLTYINYLVIH